MKRIKNIEKLKTYLKKLDRRTITKNKIKYDHNRQTGNKFPTIS
jgi:hypothetical protein